ncbi:MAG: hypothetical protein V2A67_07090 [Bacteroidota bacterium]
MKKSFLIILIICVLPLTVDAQEELTVTPPPDSISLVIDRLGDDSRPGKVRVIQDPRLTSVLRKHAAYNFTVGVPGWRILIYKGLDRIRANQVKADFENAFGNLGLPVEVQYTEPDFSTLVGSFRTKEDAFRFKKQVETRFTQAYLVHARVSQD